jgi:hypothetical protein
LKNLARCFNTEQRNQPVFFQDLFRPWGIRRTRLRACPGIAIAGLAYREIRDRKNF